MSHSQKVRGHATSAAALAGWGVVFWIAFWVAPYLYAFNDLIQWR